MFDTCLLPPPRRASERRSHSDEWLATLSHELRSPLATIVMALESISSGLDQHEARKACDIAERQALKAIQIVDNLFDICAGAHCKLTFCKEAVKLADLVARATETANHLLTSRRHRLTVSLQPELISIYGDPLRLEQVLTNLLTNAAKFTDPGGHIHVTAQTEGNEVVLRVRDNGRGILPEVLPQVFDLFIQAPPGHGIRPPRGLGLGLTLVKSLVELHEGCVTATSRGPGTGSEFIVRLPVAGDRND